tara:strand:- start:376 stop:717 length:342 start_codon:yes stop_codon:yes gene_type:complete
MSMIGRNVNSNGIAIVTSYALNSVTATTISLPNDKRIFFSVCLDYGITDEDIAIRLYPAGTDNLVKGEMLTRRTASNDSLFRPSWTMMTDNPYTGEISAITGSGLMTVHVTEY